MKVNKREYFPIALVILAFFIAMYLYPYMPDVMPSHWAANGEADSYSVKAFALFFLPIVTLFLYVLLSLIPRVAVYKQNIKKFEVQYFRFKIAFVVFMFALYIATLVQAIMPFSMNFFIVPGLSFLFFFTGNLLKYAHRNFFIGFRTPWTLSSDKVWKKTNLVAAKFFTIYAFVILLALFIPRFAIAIIILPLAIAIPWMVYYSYKLFKEETTPKKKSKKK